MKSENKNLFYSLEEIGIHYKKLYPSQPILICSEKLLDRAKKISSPDWVIVPIQGLGDQWLFYDKEKK